MGSLLCVNAPEPVAARRDFPVREPAPGTLRGCGGAGGRRALTLPGPEDTVEREAAMATVRVTR